MIQGCLDDETVAAYVDGRIEPEKRRLVDEHLASCEDCYALLSELLHQERETQAAKVVQLPKKQSGGFSWNRRTVFASGALAVIAASLVMIAINLRSPIGPLVQAVGEERLTMARPTGGFRYGPLRSRTRGSSEPSAPLAVLTEATALRERATSSETPTNRHAWGIAMMLTGDLAGSIVMLGSARDHEPENGAYESDLGAAFLTRFLDERRDDDATQAMESFERATSLDPSLAEAWFNKALLLEALGKTGDAATAWNRYLEIDSSSPWSNEARRHRDALKR
jgi:tetratricopeptide (TPR) repeat protein